MASAQAIQLPLAQVGSVNAWLLRGDPMTLVDTGPRTDAALQALEDGLRARGARVEDIELVIGTHHHHDHVGLAATIKRRSGARIALPGRAADYVARYAEHVAYDRAFARSLMGAHGAPPELLDRSDALWEYIGATAESVQADVRLSDGDRIRAGGRELRAAARPGHSASDTLLVDDQERVALVGDHLLARISPNTEIYATDASEPGRSSRLRSRSRSRVDYIRGLRQTAEMGLQYMLPGHGPPVVAPETLIKRQLDQHRRRCRKIMAMLERGPASAFELGRQLWGDRIAREQPLLVLWEVLGHLDLLIDAGVAAENIGNEHRVQYSLERRPAQREVNRSLVRAS